MTWTEDWSSRKLWNGEKIDGGEWKNCNKGGGGGQFVIRYKLFRVYQSPPFQVGVGGRFLSRLSWPDLVNYPPYFAKGGKFVTRHKIYIWLTIELFFIGGGGQFVTSYPREGKT